jgi:hypothetical protein
MFSTSLRWCSLSSNGNTTTVIYAFCFLFVSICFSSSSNDETLAFKDNFFSKWQRYWTNLDQVNGTPASLNLLITVSLSSIFSPDSWNRRSKKRAIISFYQGFKISSLSYLLLMCLIAFMLTSSSESSTLFISYIPYRSLLYFILVISSNSAKLRFLTPFFIYSSSLFSSSSSSSISISAS